MDFAALPPEINSARMYSGPGSGSLQAAAAAWDELATELYSAASSYHSILSTISGTWQGASSVSMAAAGATYVAWLNRTAAQAEQTAAAARAAAAAYETALTMTVPPPIIAANRSTLMALMATNLVGQNTAAIAATEAHYAEMWAQDAAAMYSYSAASAAATTLRPFEAPRPVVNAGALAGQAAAETQLSSTVPTSSAPGLAGILQTTDPTSLLSLFGPVDAGLSSSELATASGAWQSASDADAAIMGSHVEIADTHDLITSTLSRITSLDDEIIRRFDQLGTVRSAVSARLGHAASVGALSVPHSWPVAPPAIRTVDAAGPIATPQIAGVGSETPWAETALAGVAGQAIGGAGTNTRVRAMPAFISPTGPVTRIAAELRELAELHDQGVLTDAEFSEQKRRLLA